MIGAYGDTTADVWARDVGGTWHLALVSWPNRARTGCGVTIDAARFEWPRPFEPGARKCEKCAARPA